jgi:TonB family protein
LPAASLVYPVTAAKPNVRVPGIVVSSGPGGGGGLRVYGVLHGKRIYTVYLTMPGKNWILQYCSRDESHPPSQASRVVQVLMEPPLVPPSPISQFDFHRPATMNEPPGSMIILHGLIGEDGGVSSVEIQQGLEPTLNDAALAAFSRWKFNPALRNGSAITVEILVGIPALVPGS